MVTDEREVNARRSCSAPLKEIPEQDTHAYEVAFEACVEELRGMRNQPGGYWIAATTMRTSGPAEVIDLLRNVESERSRSAGRPTATTATRRRHHRILHLNPSTDAASLIAAG